MKQTQTQKKEEERTKMPSSIKMKINQVTENSEKLSSKEKIIELAKELIAYSKAIYPEMFEYYGDIRIHKAVNIPDTCFINFWKAKGLLTETKDGDWTIKKNYELIVERATHVAHEMLNTEKEEEVNDYSILEEESVENLAKSFIKFFESLNLQENIYKLGAVYYQNFQEFWESIGIKDVYNTKGSHRIKMNQVENKIRELLDEKAKLKRKENFEDLSKEILRWAKAKGLKKITRTHLEQFLIKNPQCDLTYYEKPVMVLEVNEHLHQ